MGKRWLQKKIGKNLSPYFSVFPGFFCNFGMFIIYYFRTQLDRTEDIFLACIVENFCISVYLNIMSLWFNNVALNCNYIFTHYFPTYNEYCLRQ